MRKPAIEREPWQACFDMAEREQVRRSQLGIIAMRTIRKKEILNRGYSFGHFQGWHNAFVSELPRLSPNHENPFLQNGNTPLGKSQTL